MDAAVCGCRDVLSFRSEAREVLDSETARVHHAHRRRGALRPAGYQSNAKGATHSSCFRFLTLPGVSVPRKRSSPTVLRTVPRFISLSFFSRLEAGQLPTPRRWRTLVIGIRTKAVEPGFERPSPVRSRAPCFAPATLDAKELSTRAGRALLRLLQ